MATLVVAICSFSGFIPGICSTLHVRCFLCDFLAWCSMMHPFSKKIIWFNLVIFMDKLIKLDYKILYLNFYPNRQEWKNILLLGPQDLEH
jgi:hypothetical protein